MTQTLTWLDRWDAQQQTYLPDREERFEVMLDVLEQVAPAAPRVLDLACGPASLGRRVLARFDGAHVVGADADPVLLELARTDQPAGLQLVDVDLRRAGWQSQLPFQEYDAVLTTTALHWLHESDLTQVYATCAGLLRPGGVLLNGDHLQDTAAPLLTELALGLDRLRKGGPAEDWQQWWAAIGQDPDFAEPFLERQRRSFDHPDTDEISLAVHERALRAGGFSEVSVLWRKGTDAVLAALR